LFKQIFRAQQNLGGTKISGSNCLRIPPWLRAWWQIARMDLRFVALQIRRQSTCILEHN